MITIDFKNNTFSCPYCGKEQTYSRNNMYYEINAYKKGYSESSRTPYEQSCDITVFHILCSNNLCKKLTVIARNQSKQWDLIPDNVCKHYPDYVPLQIRNDYEEASSVIERSPKAAATLLRRCLQGMIHDFWDIHEKNLNAEITQLKDKIPATQWKAIDGLRSIGNIGAHMEKEVDLIIDIEPQEAFKLQKLIELLMEKWYISRHDEEVLFAEIAQTAGDKQEQRKSK